MYHHVDGELIHLSPSRAIVEAAGVGYELFIPFSTFSAIKSRQGPSEANGGGRRVRLLTHLLVREDLFRLYGFFSEAERQLFRAVLSVSGLGPTLALAVLSSVEVGAFRSLIEAGDPAPLQRIRGIGKKLASRLVLELKDRLDDLPIDRAARVEAGAGGRAGAASSGASASEALLALLELGFPRPEAEKRIQGAIQSLAKSSAPGRLDVEAILKQALRVASP
jgi:Holliday junction DNA helicase RuvA